MKNLRNALLVSAALTGMLLAYFAVSGQTDQITGLWVYAVAMFFGVFGYLLFAGRRKRHNHRR